MSGIHIRIRIDAALALEAFKRAPDVMVRHVDEAVEAGAQYVAREAMRRAPKWQSTLTNSIHVTRVEDSPPDVLAWAARTGVNYARYVEEGVRPGRMPGAAHGLEEWVRSRIGAANSAALRRLTYAVALGIKRHGIRPRPYMAPAIEASEQRVRLFVRGGVAKGIAEVFGAG